MDMMWQLTEKIEENKETQDDAPGNEVLSPYFKLIMYLQSCELQGKCTGMCIAGTFI